ncbi:MAG: rhodanese-like domain-containing protein [Planctomycetota bacterium]|nr:rhodanese-like domain-containing protein [Planctomycetota bacterium]
MRERVLAGEALLVCAYDSPVSFPKFPLPGAIPLERLRQLEPELARDTELVFYCRCPNDKTSVERAREYLARGFTNSSVLAGGFQSYPRGR